MYGVYQHQDGEGVVWHSARVFSWEQDAENYAVSLTIRAREAGMIGASYWPEPRD